MTHGVESRREGVLVGFGDGTGISALEDAPPPPAPAVADPVRLHSGIRAPVKLTNVAPVYPPTALAVRLQGLVILEATIDVDGNVASAKVLKSVPLLDQAAVDAVGQWKFTPTLLNGVPVSVIMTVTVNFKLE
jgi:protein TonB